MGNYKGVGNYKPSAGATVTTKEAIRTGGNFTTTSTSAIDMTDITITMASSGTFIVVVAITQSNTNDQSTKLLIDDGGSDTANIEADTDPINNRATLVQTAIGTSSSQIVKAQWYVGAGTGTVFTGANIKAIEVS